MQIGRRSCTFFVIDLAQLDERDPCSPCSRTANRACSRGVVQLPLGRPAARFATRRSSSGATAVVAANAFQVGDDRPTYAAGRQPQPPCSCRVTFCRRRVRNASSVLSSHREPEWPSPRSRCSGRLPARRPTNPESDGPNPFHAGLTVWHVAHCASNSSRPAVGFRAAQSPAQNARAEREQQRRAPGLATTHLETSPVNRCSRTRNRPSKRCRR